MKYLDYNIIYVSVYTEGSAFKISNDAYETLSKVGHGIAVLNHPNFGAEATAFFDKIDTGIMFTTVLNGANNTPTPISGFVGSDRVVHMYGM